MQAILRNTIVPVAVLAVAITLSGCQRPLSAGEAAPPKAGEQAVEQGEALSAEEPIPQKTPTVTPQDLLPDGAPDSDPTATPQENPPDPAPHEAASNPFTGLPVEDLGSLELRPILVSISNFPPSARPQSGLSYASHVYSTFIGYGMNRFLALVYGEDLIHLGEIFDNRLAEGGGPEYAIGPVRSGRVAFEDIKSLYPHAALITAGASPEVLAQLSNQTSVYGSNEEDINSTGVSPQALAALANGSQVNPDEYHSLVFDSEAPEGGSEAGFVRVVYNYLNQNGWQFDPELGRYMRMQDQADGSGELFPTIDALTGEPLGFENVIVLWAQHTYVSPTVIEINLAYIWDHFGLLYRDGMVYEIKWATRSGKLTIYDSEGNSVPLKPGRTWFEVVSYQTTWDRAKSIVRFHEPPSDW